MFLLNKGSKEALVLINIFHKHVAHMRIIPVLGILDYEIDLSILVRDYY